MLTLYHSHFSTCSQKVRLCLAEKQLSFISRHLDLAAQEHLTASYLAMNPNGVVPTLVHDDVVVIESSVICEYLDEVFDGAALTPVGAVGRARMRAWMRYLEEVPTAAIRVPSFNRIFAGAFERHSDEDFEQLTERMPLRRDFYREMGRDGFTSTRVGESLRQLSQTLQRAESVLSGAQWLLGAQFSIADILLIPTVVRMDDLGLARLWSDLPRVTDWYARVQARPAFAAAFYPGSRLTSSFSWLHDTGARGSGPTDDRTTDRGVLSND